VRQQLVRSEIARLAPVENGLGDVRGEIAEEAECHLLLIMQTAISRSCSVSE
jgi:hypothetical protein